MEFKIEVEIYSASGKSNVEVTITDEELRTLAENKVMSEYSCDSCAAKSLEVIHRL